MKIPRHTEASTDWPEQKNVVISPVQDEMLAMFRAAGKRHMCHGR